ncbi:MAG: hypothetical protein A2284_05415 [Deltaproteobacteria bacterium RIFOXYA12_FULL_61_11]|nr:MAG: hypothetical protein A2284_05415 [Deltaproteobacteria bacterium RIFOXYA12_FULL_61_11]
MNGYSILIVDDEREMRLALRLGLSRLGHRVEEASDGEEALLKLTTTSPDLVISDIRMPRMDGLTFLRNLRVTHPSLPVIVMSAHGSIDTAVEAMKLGADDFVIKPFSLDVIEGLLRKLLGRADRPIADNSTVITQDPGMQHIVQLLDSIAQSKATVLLEGESGTGKEVLARYLHAHSDRATGPFVAINCAALPENLLESELFGHEKGAFTGALERKLGKFEQAEGGTILLDEISEMNLFLQAKLLRVLQEHTVDRIGGKGPIKVNMRVVATTNRDLLQYVREGKFREDLYYRLNVIPVKVPPLRSRKQDVPLLARHFLAQVNSENGLHVEGIGAAAMNRLLAHSWTGNVRELRNAIERAVLVSKRGQLEYEHFNLPDSRPAPMAEPAANSGLTVQTFQVGMTMKDVEREMIIKTLHHLEGNRTHAAEMLGISIRTLRNKLREYRQANLPLDCSAI